MAFLKIGCSETTYILDVKGDAKDIKISIGDSAIKALPDTALQVVIKTVGKTASKVIASGGDIITAPAL